MGVCGGGGGGGFCACVCVCVCVCVQDILPREVLEDDGSREDREDANKPHLAPNYGRYAP